MVPEMSTSTTPDRPKPTAFPYAVSDPAEAVKLFFAEHVHVSDPKMKGDTSTPEMRERICELVASTVSDRLHKFWSHEPYGENEELEFTFKKIGEHSGVHDLVSPIPVVQDLEYRFHGVGIFLRSRTHDFAMSGSGNYVLRVSPQLVTFGGNVVWREGTK
jgi:hypothetical protein